MVLRQPRPANADRAHTPASDRASTAGRRYRPDAIEVAAGSVFGHLDDVVVPRRAASRPRAVLEDLLARALSRPPCVVSFSGGRDSSAMLAMAVDVARRHDLPMPVPVTRRFPHDPASQEQQWQELVVRHVGIDEWVTLDLTDECDLLGTDAIGDLRRHGLRWPPAAHTIVPVVKIARGGTVITGEGGDEVFGIRRSTPLRHLHGGARRRRAALKVLGTSVGTRRSRRWALARVFDTELAMRWLSGRGHRAVTAQWLDHQLAEPLSWPRSTRHLAARRSWVLGSATIDAIAHDHAVAMCHPLLDRAFLAAASASGAALGPMTRSGAMRELFGHVLPDPVLKRRDKATFNTAVFGAPSRYFAESWNGEGVDTDLVRPDALASAWSEPMPHAGTFLLLQQAWLHNEARA